MENNQNNSNESMKNFSTGSEGVSPVSNNNFEKPEQKDLINTENKTTFSLPDDKIKINSLHTYADDVRDAVQNDGVSMAKIMMAEVKKQEDEKTIEEETSPTSTKNKSIIAISIITLLVACVGFAGTWYFIGKRDEALAPAVSQHRSTIIPYDEEHPISLEFRERIKMVDGIYSAKMQKYANDTSIVYLPVVENGGTSTNLAITSTFLSNMETRVSPALVRSFGNEFMLGLNKSSGKMEPFILLTSDSFNQMYAGMLEWEPAIADDIGDLFFTKEDLIETLPPVSTSTDNVKSTTTAQVASGKTGSSTKITANTSPVASSTLVAVASTSSSSPIIDPAIEKEFKSRYIIANSLKFKDEILNNRDLRVLRTTSGKVLMYYVFINDKILLIAKDFGTLNEVAKRLATSQFKQ